MIAIDTNVLVRVLVDDPSSPAQCEQARTLLKENSVVFISQIVLVETVWVLESAYRFDKSQLITVLEHIARNPNIRLEAFELLDGALSLYRSSRADFSDYLILAQIRSKQLTLYTFDRKLGRLQGAQLMKEAG
jgi:predicted nucleic-acid-binding protein